MSLIHTAELNGIAPFEYLVALQRHHQEVARDPRAWLPWTYEATLAELQAPGQSVGLSADGPTQPPPPPRHPSCLPDPPGRALRTPAARTP